LFFHVNNKGNNGHSDDATPTPTKAIIVCHLSRNLSQRTLTTCGMYFFNDTLQVCDVLNVTAQIFSSLFRLRKDHLENLRSTGRPSTDPSKQISSVTFAAGAVLNYRVFYNCKVTMFAARRVAQVGKFFILLSYCSISVNQWEKRKQERRERVRFQRHPEVVADGFCCGPQVLVIV
jgi:hypothetical protein